MPDCALFQAECRPYLQDARGGSPERPPCGVAHSIPATGLQRDRRFPDFPQTFRSRGPGGVKAQAVAAVGFLGESVVSQAGDQDRETAGWLRFLPQNRYRYRVRIIQRVPGPLGPVCVGHFPVKVAYLSGW